jgi:hypothetical protein
MKIREIVIWTQQRIVKIFKKENKKKKKLVYQCNKE